MMTFRRWESVFWTSSQDVGVSAHMGTGVEMYAALWGSAKVSLTLQQGQVGIHTQKVIGVVLQMMHQCNPAVVQRVVCS